MINRENILTIVVIVIFILVCFMVYQIGWDYRERKTPINTPVTSTDAPQDTIPTLTPLNPHKEYIDRHEKEAGMPLTRIASLIIKEEGIKPFPYLDSRGTVTIGIGRSLQTNGISTTELHAIIPVPEYKAILLKGIVRDGRILISTISLAKQVFPNPLTEHDMMLLLTDDLKTTQQDAVKVFGSNVWGKVERVRKEAIVDLIYNLGLTHFRGFTHFIDDVKKQDWGKAASDLLMSEAARQNIARYHRIASVIQTGDERYFGLVGK